MKNNPNIETLKYESDLPRRSRRAFCPRCKKSVDLKSFAEVAAFFGYPAWKVLEMAQDGKLHRLFNRRAILMICADSFFKTCLDISMQEFNTRLLPRLDSITG